MENSFMYRGERQSKTNGQISEVIQNGKNKLHNYIVSFLKTDEI